MKAAKWIIAGIASYGATAWIKNLWVNIVVSMAVWYFVLYLLDRFLEV